MGIASNSGRRGSRPARSERRVLNGRALLVAASAAAILGPGGVMAPGADATQPACAVTNARAHKTFSTLQEAVNAAEAGNKLTVRGTCVGDTAIAKDLTIVGQASSGSGTPTLNGANTAG